MVDGIGERKTKNGLLAKWPNFGPFLKKYHF